MEKSTHLDRLEWERNRTAEELRQLKRRLDTTSSSAFPPSTAVKELKDEIDIYRVTHFNICSFHLPRNCSNAILAIQRTRIQF